MLASRPLLDRILAVHISTPRHKDNILAVKRRNELIPVVHLDDMRVERGLGLRIEVALDSVEGSLDISLEVGKANRSLSAGVTAGSKDLLLLGVLGAELETEGNTLELPVVELVAGGVGVAEIGVGADAGLLEALLDGPDLVVELLALGLGGLCGETAGDEDGLNVGDAGREDETLVVAVDHDADADDTGGETPGVLPDEEGILLLGFRGGGVLDGDAKHLGEVLAETVGGGTLDTTSGGGDIALAGGGEETAGKLLLLGLAATDGGDGKELRVDARVVVENLKDFLLGGLARQVRSVALLPEELTGAEEGLRILELPADDRVPLVETERKVAVRADPLGVVGVHDGLGGRTDSNGLVELVLAARKSQFHTLEDV